jgi:hypothetical protein
MAAHGPGRIVGVEVPALLQFTQTIQQTVIIIGACGRGRDRLGEFVCLYDTYQHLDPRPGKRIQLRWSRAVSFLVSNPFLPLLAADNIICAAKESKSIDTVSSFCYTSTARTSLLQVIKVAGLEKHATDLR